MPGELWRGAVQIGKEVTSGTSVAATRKLYWRTPTLTQERAIRLHKFSTATRDNQRAATNGPVQAGGTFEQAMSADEIIELLLLSVQGSVTPTTPSGATLARLWTFKPSTTLDSATIEWDDGARPWEEAGCRIDTLTIAGSVGEENLVTGTIFGTNLTQAALTGALSDRTPTFLEGWQTRLWVDAFGTTPGSTLIPGTLLSWNISVNNQLGRKYTADNTLAANSITVGELEIEASLTFEAASTFSLTEFNNWNAATKRLVRLEFLDEANGIEAGTNEVQTLTITGTPTGGTVTLVFAGSTSGTIAHNASIGTIQSTLEAVATIGTGNVVVAGGPWPGTAVTVTFQGALGTQNVPQIALGTNALTGGTTPTLTPTTTTPGRSGRRYVTIDIPGVWTAVNLGGEDAGTRAYELSLSYVYDSVLAAGIAFNAQNNRTAAY